MDGNFQRSALALLIGILRWTGAETSQGCTSPQYLELGKTGTIACSFEEGFYGVYWYNSTDVQQAFPMIYLSSSAKYGNGYTTGEFDIYPNGSLLINNVTLQHDKVFTVTFLQSQRDAEIKINVLSVVYVIPLPPVPLIQECEEEWTTPVCFLEVNKPLELICSVNDTWPAFGLNWILRRAGGDKNVTSKLRNLTEDARFTFIVTTNVLANSSLMLHLLACVADSPPGVLVRNYSYILVQNTKIDWTDFEKIPKVFERFSKMELICTEDQTSFLVWKKITSSTVTKNIMYAVVFENMVVNRVDEDYSFGRKNSLILPNINLNHKGLYACVYSNGISDGVTVYDVTVIVHPVPSYLVIQNCSKDQYCLLEVEHRGNLTCHVRGIFPEVELKWMVLDFDESVIAFTKERIQITKKDDLFEVSLTATYEVKVLPRNKMSVKCLAVGPNADHFNLTRKIDLYFPNGLPTETEEQLTKEQGSQYVWIALIVPIAAIVITVIIIKRNKGRCIN